MKISTLQISNFRSIEDLRVTVGDVLALIGRNNSGKSNLLEALELFFNPSVRYVDDSTFFHHETDRTIRLMVEFDQLTAWDRETFGPWVDDNKLVVGREITCTGDESYSIDHLAVVSLPEPLWLREEEISGDNIDEWWDNQDQLNVRGLDFAETLGTSKPLVGEWEDAAEEFVEGHSEEIPFQEEEVQNPKGATNVLKGSLPEFIYIPAVRDVADETKVTQSNPFGQLIHSVLDQISEGQKTRLQDELAAVAGRLNREGEAERIDEISEIEENLNGLMNEIMEVDVELAMELPELQEVFGEATIYADDGVRTEIGLKGHGMQRSMILTILRQYAELARQQKAGDRADQRSTIIAIEEPELYLHPQSQRTMMSVFREIAAGTDQVIYSTHSSHFVNIDFFDEICRMQRTEDEDTGQLATTAVQLTTDMLIADLEDRKGVEATEEGIRSQYQNAFDIALNEGFFADKVVIVEGPSEANLLPTVAKSLGVDFDRKNIAVVHGDGKGQMDRLSRIFSGFGIPVFLWFDGDIESNDADTRAKTLELLQLLGEEREDIEAVETEVGANYAVLETTLEDTLEAEIVDYAELVEQAQAELGPCGKPMKAQFVADVLSDRINDEGQHRCPDTIREIVTRIDRLDQTTAILTDAAEEHRAVSPLGVNDA